MTRDDFVAIFNDAVNMFREQAPKDTGHLALNAVKGRWISENHFKIWIDRDVIENHPRIRVKDGENVMLKPARHYYAKTINNNPNYKTYGFVERIARNIAEYIANRIGGIVEK